MGNLENVKFQPEYTHDSWVQSALTVEGKIADFDLVYAGAYLTRNTHEAEDYTDYSLAYDSGYGKYFLDNAGKLIDPAQYIIGRDHYTKLSNEVRLSSPQNLAGPLHRGPVRRAPGARHPAGLRGPGTGRSARGQLVGARLAGHGMAHRPDPYRP